MFEPLETTRLFLHVLAATIWVGGQLTLVALLPVLRAAGGDIPAQAARAFNRIAWPAFWLLVATGIWNYYEEIDGRSDSWRTTLLVKIVIVAISGVTAWLHAHARTRSWVAVNGALTGVTALGALLLGVALS